MGMEKMIGLSKGWLTFFLLVMLGIAYLDYSTGKNLAVWGLYVIPVAAASWMGGFRAGLILSAASCVLMFAVGTYGGTVFASEGFFLLRILNRLIALLMVAWLASYLFRRQMLESTLSSYEECLDYLHVSPRNGVEGDQPEKAGQVDNSVQSSADPGR